MQGYIEMARNHPPYGICGIAKQPSYPLAGKGPGPTPPGPQTGPYENPFNGPCEAGELNTTVTGITGAFCAPPCPSGSCPADPPLAGKANPQCILQTPDHKKYCGLVCEPSSSSSCDPSKKLTCKSIQGTGLCTYNGPDKPGPGPGPTPGPGPGPSPTPAPGDYYKNPFDGPCGMAVEKNLTIPNSDGRVSAVCSVQGCGAGKLSCPASPNFAKLAIAACAFDDPYDPDNKFCALACDPTDSNACDPMKKMACAHVPVTGDNPLGGICTYTDKSEISESFPVTLNH